MTQGNWNLFFALWPPDEVRAQLAQSAALLKKAHPTPGRWIAAARYHLTLHFLGAYPLRPEAWAAKAAAAAARVACPPVHLRLDQAGSFQNRQIPWWIGPAQTPDELRRLWRELRDELRASAVPYDSGLRLTPHVTVVRDAGRTLPLRPLPPVDWAVHEFVLIESFVGTPAAYRIVGRWPLKPGGGRDAGHAPQLDLWDNPPSSSDPRPQH